MFWTCQWSIGVTKFTYRKNVLVWIANNKYQRSYVYECQDHQAIFVLSITFFIGIVGVIVLFFLKLPSSATANNLLYLGAALTHLLELWLCIMRKVINCAHLSPILTVVSLPFAPDKRWYPAFWFLPELFPMLLFFFLFYYLESKRVSDANVVYVNTFRWSRLP